MPLNVSTDGPVSMHGGIRKGKRSKTASGGSRNLWNQPANLPFVLTVTTGDRRWDSTVWNQSV